MSQRPPSRFLWKAAPLTLLLFAMNASFSTTALSAEPAHRWRWELRTGYGWQYTNESRPNHFQITPFMPSVAVPLTGTMGPGFLRGRFEWNPELFLALFNHPYVRPILGITPLQFHYELEPKGKWSPYLMLGAGVFRSDINRRETGSRINFNPQGAVGIRYALGNRFSLLGEYRHTHISNAGLNDDNSGMNTHTFLVGISVEQ